MNQSSSRFILIVDDNPDNLAVLAQTIKGAGYSVRVAIDGETALEQISLESPALILLDIMMPGIDGFETCRQIKAIPKFLEVPVIFMTALSDSETKAKGLRLGAIDYITKPFEEIEVLARVEVHLRMSELLCSMRSQNQQLAAEISKRQRAESQLKAFNQELEGRIKVGTAALSQATNNLQQAQDQVVQSEKLSALGELVAGVAHEINNPIGCITNNVKFVEEYGQQLLEHIEIYQKVLAIEQQNIQADSLSEITNHAEDIDLEYVTEDFFSLVKSMSTSGDRIKAISQSLRTFARADKTHRQNYDLHKGIDGTLLILRHRLKSDGDRPEVVIHKQYGQLPNINCYPGQINQVFMNILANAIDALENREHNLEPPTISIETVLAGELIGIKITDNAGGMPETIRMRIFESQFTTKAAGKGTGLGLSIAHKIVTENHGGQIECTSTAGKGTTFRITLPFSQQSLSQ